MALRWAVDEARLRSAALVAVLVWGWLNQHPLPGGPEFDPSYDAAAARQALDAFVDRAVGPDANEVGRRVVNDLPARALLVEARDADLLVVGARGLGGLRGLLLGSVSQRCAHLAMVPVAIVRERSESRTGPVVVGVDGSGASCEALGWAADEACRRGSQLEVVHAWRDGTAWLPRLLPLHDSRVAESEAARLVAGLIDERVEGDLCPGVVISSTGAAAALVEASATASLLVVGNHGHGTVGGTLLGSVAQQVAHHAACPLVLVPASRVGRI
jgi:nucleotide-binding universal stress UspA family protein